MHSDEESWPGEHKVSFMFLLQHFLHKTAVMSLKKFKVMDAEIGVMDRNSRRLVAIGLGPLCLCSVDVLWFGEGALQGHISAWKCVDHFFMYNDVSELALKTNGRVFSTIKLQAKLSPKLPLT